MTFDRSVVSSSAAFSPSSHSGSSIRTDRCWVFGLLGTRQIVPGERTGFNAAPGSSLVVYVHQTLRCTYTLRKEIPVTARQTRALTVLVALIVAALIVWPML